MTIKTAPNRRLLISKNLILMLVMAVLIILAILAWFSFSKTVTADNIVVKAVSSEIDIAESVKTYDAQQNVLTDGPGVFGSEVNFNGPYNLTKDCTGDGKNLIVPEFNVPRDAEEVRQTGGKEVNVNLTPANALSNLDADKQKILHPNQDPPEYQYIQCEFYVRSKNKELNLAADSQLLSKTESNGDSIFSTPSNDKKSAYGNFNVDGLVGAIRVALIGQPCSSCNQTFNNGTIATTNAGLGGLSKQLLWVPRPDVYLLVNPQQGDLTNWSLHRVPTNNAQYSDITYKNSYYIEKEPGEGDGVVKVDPDNDGRTKISNDKKNNIPIFGYNFNISDYGDNVTYNPINGIVVDPNDPNDPTVTDSYYISKYTMRIWIEGTDSEARRAMNGGAFDLRLSFI